MQHSGQTLCAKDWLKDFSLITANQDESVETVITRLTENNISSAPVIGPKGKYIGFVDLLDLLTFVAIKMGLPKPDFLSSKRAVKEFLAKPVGDIINVSGRNEVISVQSTTPLQDVIEILSKPDVHRVPIVNEGGDYVGIITQSDIVRYFNDNQEKLAPKLEQKVKNIWNIGTKKVQTMEHNKFVIDALVKLEESRISGIAIVDDEGKIVGNLSASDLKRMQVKPPIQLCYDVYENLHQFMSVIDWTEKVNKFKPVIIQPDETLGTAIAHIVSFNVHRIYITDQNRKPIGEISLCDIIAQFRGTQSE